MRVIYDDLKCGSGSCADDAEHASNARFFVLDVDGSWHPVCHGHLEGWYLDCDLMEQQPVVHIATSDPSGIHPLAYDVKDVPNHPASPGPKEADDA